MTVNEKKIKIFVSQRIDQISETIDNPIYINVRCGAVYDKRKPEEYGNMLGDNTGDNISSKKNQYSELTVQYWAWKNQDADYYGLCHYRRYLSFATEDFKTDELNQIECKYLNKKNMKKFGLLDQDKMIKIISDYDVVCNSSYDVKKVHVPSFRRKKCVKELLEYATSNARNWNNKPLFPKGTFDILLNIVEKMYPQYYRDCHDYLYGNKLRGYNCFIMKKELFTQFCDFEFNVLREFEKEMDFTWFPESMARDVGYMGEILYGTFINYLYRQRKYKIKELKIVFFDNTKKQENLFPAFKTNNIPIVLVSSEFYIPHVASLIQSIKEHSSTSCNYDIIIFHSGIKDELQKRIKNIEKEFPNLSVRFFDVKLKFGELDFKVSNANSSIEAYYRILTPWILESFDKAIVLDSDIIVNYDLTNLFKINICDFSLGAVKDIVYMGFLNGFVPESIEYTRDTLKLKQPYNYVNTGVLLMNLAKIRANYSSSELIDFFSNNQFKVQEQDGINSFFENDIKFLDLKWNFYVEENEDISRAIDWAPQKYSNLYRQINVFSDSNFPYIIHFANQPKPWDSPFVKYASFYWKYAKRTDFYENALFGMLIAANSMVMNRGQLSFARRMADRLMPKGSLRREALKKIIPRGSWQFEFLKKMYHKFTI